MSNLVKFLASLAIVCVAVAFVGCSDSPTDDAESENNSEDAGHDGDGSHVHADGTVHEGAHDTAAENKEKMLADLSADDRALVEKQRICPVGEGLLWGMGTPYKTTVTDSQDVEHVVFLCCDGCEEAIQDDPDTYLAVLTKAAEEGAHDQAEGAAHTHGDEAAHEHAEDADAGHAEDTAHDHAEDADAGHAEDTAHDHAEDADAGHADEAAHEHAEDADAGHAEDTAHDHAEDAAHDHADEAAHDHAEDAE